MKTCNKCGIEKDLAEFNSRVAMCRDCHKTYNRQWYENNLEKQKANAAKQRKIRHTKIREIIDAAKNVSCADCGIKYHPKVMDLDHRENKVFNVSEARQGSWTIQDVILEIAKCDVVCANCHRHRTFALVNPLTSNQ